MRKVCIKDNELNINYHKVFGEEKAKADGYSVFEIPDGYEDFSREDFDDSGFNIELYNTRKEKEKNQYKIVEYKTWFKDYFEYQLTQSLWQSDFIPSHDEYFDKDYADIDELKQQAEFVRREIKRFEQLKEV